MEIKPILLVEDSPNDVELILVSLSESNLENEVVVMSDGEEALNYLYRRGRFRQRIEGNPVVVMLDLKLPKIDGLEVLASLKSDPDLKIVPVVILTSSREEPDLSQCYQLGANAYVVKPIDFQEFMQAIKNIGLFWAVINEPPPGSIAALRNNRI